MTGDPQSVIVGDTAYLIGYASGIPDPSALVNPSPERIAELVAMSWRDYLQTPEWREKRRLAISRAEHRCNRCRRISSRLEAHHVTYARLGNEHPNDLEVLCAKCHAEHHGRQIR